MAGIALLELMLLLLAVGLLVWVFGASRNLPPAQEEQAHRLEAALAEIGRLGGRLPHLHDALKPAQQYGRDLRKLLPQLAELERFLAKPSTEGPTRDRLLVRHHELMRGFERGVEYLERLGAELLLVSGSEEPPALAELPQLLIELREVLHPPHPTRG
ncbi:MAG: hypothetical protein KatS3mg070_2870 [Meiothermus sp.]|uniref:hypothetical protein n=1 Tax=Meiothermus sp. TaxID=1955249 RepID=UPI0021DE82AF|nr:hypothetical protein [Meiothermus sp.]GIW29507.1 MAG: hypothetical protein KatS3mg070_2870 [Meiothermus sp.]